MLARWSGPGSACARASCPLEATDCRTLSRNQVLQYFVALGVNLNDFHILIPTRVTHVTPYTLSCFSRDKKSMFSVVLLHGVSEAPHLPRRGGRLLWSLLQGGGRRAHSCRRAQAGFSLPRLFPSGS